MGTELEEAYLVKSCYMLVNESEEPRKSPQPFVMVDPLACPYGQAIFDDIDHAIRARDRIRKEMNNPKIQVYKIRYEKVSQV